MPYLATVFAAAKEWQVKLVVVVWLEEPLLELAPRIVSVGGPVGLRVDVLREGLAREKVELVVAKVLEIRVSGFEIGVEIERNRKATIHAVVRRCGHDMHRKARAGILPPV